MKFEREPDGKTWSVNLCHYDTEGWTRVKVSMTGELLFYYWPEYGEDIPELPDEWDACCETFFARFNMDGTLTAGDSLVHFLNSLENPDYSEVNDTEEEA